MLFDCLNITASDRIYMESYVFCCIVSISLNDESQWKLDMFVIKLEFEKFFIFIVFCAVTTSGNSVYPVYLEIRKHEFDL